MSPLAALGLLALLGLGPAGDPAPRLLTAETTAPVSAGARELTLGPVRGPDGERPQTLWVGASQGTVERDADGRLSVRLPDDRHPRAVVVAFTDGVSGGAAFVPVAGVTELPVETDRPTQVTVEVAGRRFGPVVCSDRIRVPIEVPPGVRQAEVRATDQVGDTTRVTVDLQAPAAPRVAVAFPEGALEAGGLRWGVAAVAGPRGGPAEAARLQVRSTHGQVTALQRLAPGVWAFGYRAPDRPTRDQLELTWAGVEAPATRLTLPGPPWAGARLVGGLGGGVSTNLGALVAPRWVTHLRYERPLHPLTGGMVLGLELLRWSDAHQAVLGGAPRTLDRTLTAVTVPLLLRAATHTWPLGLYLQAGPTFTWYRAEVEADFQAPERRAGLVAGLRLGVGGFYALGPGRLTLEARGGATRLVEGPLRGQIEGFALVAGYELDLARLGEDR